jgi:hypothetical protein
MAARLTKLERKSLLEILGERNVPWIDVWLFGSTAQGLADSGSDRDFLVILPDSFKEDLFLLQCKLNGMAGIRGLRFDILLARQHDFLTNMVSPILHEVRKWGKKVA